MPNGGATDNSYLKEINAGIKKSNLSVFGQHLEIISKNITKLDSRF